MAAIDRAYWRIDANAAWGTGSSWATRVHGSSPATYTAAVPGASDDVSLTPFDPATGMPTGTTPFTITYNTTGRVYALEGPAFATLAIQGGTLFVAQAMTDGGVVSVAAGLLEIQNGLGANDTSSIGGGLQQTGGTVKVDAGTLTLTGPSSIAGTLAGAGAITLEGTGTIASGAKASVGTLGIEGSGTTVTLDETLTYGGTFGQKTGTTLTLAGGALALTGGASFSGATVNGSKTLYAEGASTVANLTIGGTVVFDVTASMNQVGGGVTVGDAAASAAVLLIATGSTYLIQDDSGIGRGAAAGSRVVNKGSFRKMGGYGTSTLSASFVDTGTVAVTTGTLTFTGVSNNIAGALTGDGTVQFGGGSTVLSAGMTASVRFLNLFGSTTRVTLAENLTYAGVFSQELGGTLAIDRGDTLTLTDGHNNVVGHVIGAGSLVLDSGTTLLSASSSPVTVKNLALTGGELVLTNAGSEQYTNVVYTGAYTQAAGTMLINNGVDLVLRGTASFSNAYVDNGRSDALYITGATTLAGLTITTLINTGTVSQAGGDVDLEAGDDPRPLISNAGQGVWDITDDSNITGIQASSFSNQGLLEKTGGSGLSTIGMAVSSHADSAHPATIAVSSGALEIGGAVTGFTTLAIGTTLILDAQADSRVAANLTGSAATLQLNDAQDYQGTIAGLSSGKTLDLRSIVFGSGITTSLDYSGTMAGGTLTVSDGTRTAALAMLGHYAKNDFHLGTDTHGGSAITVV